MQHPRGGAAPRVLVAVLCHESNGFVSGTTPLAGFRVRRGDDLLGARGDRSPLDGLLEGASARGWRAVPAIAIEAWPSAPAEDAVLDAFVAGVREAAARGDEPLAGALLSMHGAMLTASHADAEGEAMARLRAIPRLAGVPIVACFDLHGNPSQRMCDALDAVVACRRNPHDDLHEMGLRSAAILERLLAAGARGRCIRARAGALWSPIGTGTADEPMRALESAARAVEAADPAVLEAAVFGGFAYADHADVGVAACVSVVGDASAARGRALALAAQAWRERAVGDRRNPTWDETLAAIRAAPPGPVVVAEPSDNIGAGTRGDATGLLRLLLAHDLGGEAYAAICDPAAVAALAARRPGERVRLAIGGRGWSGDAPLEREWTYEGARDGGFALEDPSGPLAALCGQRAAMGPCALVRDGAARVLLTSVATPPWDLALWRSQGLAPERARVIAVKSAIAHRRAYQGMAAAMLAVETPGPCPTELRGVAYRRLRRPIHPLDDAGGPES